MKRLFTLFALLAMLLPATAQQYMYLWQKGTYTRLSLAEVAEMPVTTAGTRITIGGVTYYTALIDSLTFVNPEVYKPKVVVTYDGNTASVEIPAAITGVTYTVDGAHVSLTSSSVTEELDFVLQGSSSAGSLLYTGNYKCNIHLNGLNLTSNRGEAINIDCGKRVGLVLTEGTENVLCDAPGGTHKAALYCRGHLEVEGAGSLTLTGRTKHALGTNEYLQLKRSTGTINVLAAESDGMHAGQYFQMNGGNVTIHNGVKGDGIQAEATKNLEDEFNGQMIFKGGVLTITLPGADVKGLKCDSDFNMYGGQLHITVTGDGSRGISTNGAMLINETENPSSIYIRNSGNVYYDPVTLNDSKSTGIKVDLDFTIEAGTVTVEHSGTKSRGIKIDGNYYNKGGTVNAEIKALNVF